MKVRDDSTEMGTSAAYWAFQASWWGLYAAIGLTINVINGGNVPNLIISHICFFVYSIGLTHVFRGQIDRQRLRHQSVIRTRLFMFAGVLVVSLIQTTLVISIDTTLNGVPEERWSPVALAGLGWGMYVGTLIWTMIYMRITEKHAQQQREIQMQLAVRAAELRALEAQINPHFLFNCLNSIRGLVVEDPPKAQDMITRFAALLRYNLNRDRQHTVPFPEEAEIVADYLALESVRFEGRLRVQVTVDPEARAMQVPPMILQALVENALKHGIARRPEGGDVEIRASASNGKLVLQVTNSGELGPAKPADTQLGLKNIRERLQLLYGDRASLSLQNENGIVVAKVEIPAISLKAKTA